ncbi:SpoIID/LytB domain-containing protein [Oerskovia enterophila]|uniref:SpoIID/LytB domain-containing protein n=1 Tax=Oerskovia enterophila TaxID=43678 RepID=UPI0037FD90E3
MLQEPAHSGRPVTHSELTLVVRPDGRPELSTPCRTHRVAVLWGVGPLRLEAPMRRSQSVIATIVAIATLMLGQGTFPASALAAAAGPTERYYLPDNGTLTIAGRGYGHGRGLSQYGARAAATLGVGYEEMLGFYYPGTQRAQRPDPSISVLISADLDNEVRVLAVPGMTASDGTTTGTAISFAGRTPQLWRVVRLPAGFYLEGLIDGAWQRWSRGASPGFLSLAAPSGFIRLVLPNGTQKDYRGTVRAVPDGTSPRLRTVNVVSMEQYLRSVVPAEMPASWPADALRAQSVAARTYASFEVSQSGTGGWQTCDTTQCQVYPGHKSFSSNGTLTADHEFASTDSAVAGTALQVRNYAGRPAFTQFSSSNGGWTAAGTQPYLVARADPWDGIGNPVHAWSVRVPVATVRQAFPGIGTPRTIDVRREGHGEWGGRVTSVVVSGTTGTTTTTGAGFRSALGLRSDWWKPTSGSRLGSDFTGDSRPDILAQTPAGELRAYNGDGQGGFTGVSTIGVGWHVMRLTARTNDLMGTGNPDVLATDAGGGLWRYPATGTGSFGARQPVGTGWQNMRALVAPGDVDRDGRADLLAIDAGGSMWLYRWTGTAFAPRTLVGPGWQAMTAVLGAGDWNADGKVDVIARDSSGRLLLYRGDGVGGFDPVKIGEGWQSMRLIGASADWDGDGRPDLVAAGGDGILYLYPWTGSGFGPRHAIGTGWASIARIF